MGGNGKLCEKPSVRKSTFSQFGYLSSQGSIILSLSGVQTFRKNIPLHLTGPCIHILLKALTHQVRSCTKSTFMPIFTWSIPTALIFIGSKARSSYKSCLHRDNCTLLWSDLFLGQNQVEPQTHVFHSPPECGVNGQFLPKWLIIKIPPRSPQIFVSFQYVIRVLEQTSTQFLVLFRYHSRIDTMGLQPTVKRPRNRSTLVLLLLLFPIFYLI